MKHTFIEYQIESLPRFSNSKSVMCFKTVLLLSKQNKLSDNFYNEINGNINKY